jgi:4-hydroxybenzoate polyprenyltransferase
VDIIATVIFVTATIAATLYSVGIRFKEKGILSYPILGYAIFGSYILYFAVFTGYPLSSAILLSVGYAMVGVGATNVTNYIGDYYFDKRATLNTAVVQIGVYPSLFLGCIMIIIGTVIAGSVSRVFYTLFLTLIPYLVSVIMAWEAKEWDVMNLASPISWLLMAVIPWMA